MTDNEFDVLDELYFLVSFEALEKSVRLPAIDIIETLSFLLNKGWVRCFINPNDEIAHDEVRYRKEYRNYYYLASKEGLLAHNSNF